MHHPLQCPFGPHRNSRHNAIRDILAKIIRKITGITPLIEQVLPGLAPNRGNVTPPTNGHNHPDEMNTTANRTDITWHTATTPIHLDVMVTSAFTISALAGNHVSSITPGFAAEQAEHYKKRKYAPHDITPIVFEAHGRMGNDTLTFLRKLTNTLPEPEQTPMYHYAVQQLSTTLQLHNAMTIEAHLDNHMTPNRHHAATVATANLQMTN